MTQQKLLDLAKQGNTQAIDVLLNRVFQLNGITAKTTIKDGYLHLLLESAQIPNQQTLVPAIRGAMSNLGIESVHSLMIYGRQTGTEQPAWTQTVPLGSAADLLPLTPSSTSLTDGPSLAVPPTSEPNLAVASVSALGFDQLPLVEDNGLTNGQGYPAEPTNGSSSPPANNLSLDAPVVSNWEPAEPDSRLEVADDDLGPVEPHLVLSEDPEPSPPATDSALVTRSSANLLGLRNVLLGLLGLMILGILWLHNSVVAKQRATIDQAQRLAASAGTASNARSLDTLKSSQQQLQQAVGLLESVPNVPASAQQQAEQELAQIKAQLADVEQKLDVEKQARADLQSAEQLVATAMGLLKESPRSPANAQQAEAKIQEAMRLLKAIPANTFVSKEAKQKLKSYQADYETAKKQAKADQKEKQKQTPLSTSKGQEKRK